MYDLDEVTAWLDNEYVPWYNAVTGGDAAKGAHTDTGSEGPPPSPPIKKPSGG